MKISNKFNLPHPLVTAALMDSYSRGESDISATELIDSPRIRMMKQIHGGDVVEDVSSMITPMLGQAFHALMEKGGAEYDTIREQRLFEDVQGWVLSGQVDRVENVSSKVPVMRDYKVTSVYTVQNPREEWISQLNVYGWLYWKKYKVFPRLEIVALCRDWRPREAQMKAGYPAQPILTLPIVAWGPEKADNYVVKRMSLHQQAQMDYDKDGTLPECSAEERWSEGNKWAVMQKGRKRALSLRPRKSEAEAEVKRQNASTTTRPNPKPHYVEARWGGERRCEGYCKFADMCDQFQTIKQDRIVADVVDNILKS